MKTLPPIHGLLREAARRRLQASSEATASRSQTKNPRLAHEAGVEAERLAVQAGEIDAMAGEDADMIVQLSCVTDFLKASQFPSALRTLALRKIEEAEMILRREIGDQPDR